MPPGIKLRFSHSRLGCLTCKIRRVKCDETQPECLKCTSTGRKCEGPLTDKFSFRRYKPKSPPTSKSPAASKSSPTSDSPSSAISRPPTPPWASAAEARAFDFYLQQAGPSIAGPLDGAFWARLLPQLCQYDQTVRRAVLAVSVFHEQPFREVKGTLSREQAHGMRWYKQSVEAALAASFAQDDATQLEHSLLTCMLFVIIEMQHANSPGAMHLLGHGYNLIAMYLKKRGERRSVAPWMSHLLPMFARQAPQIGFRLPLPPDFDATTENLLLSSIESIATFADARDASHFIGNRTLALARSIHAVGGFGRDDEIPEHMLQEQKEIFHCLDVWEQKMHDLAQNTPMSPGLRKLYHSLFCYERGMVLFLAQIFASPTDPWPQDTAAYVETLDHAEAALDASSQQSLNNARATPSVQETGVIPGICFVGWKCEDEATRQRAAVLLRRAALEENVEIARQQADTIAGILMGDPTKYDRSSQNGFEEEVFASIPA